MFILGLFIYFDYFLIYLGVFDICNVIFLNRVYYFKYLMVLYEYSFFYFYYWVYYYFNFYRIYVFKIIK